MIPTVGEQSRGDYIWSGYPSYKPSGVEWLGDIPEHWMVHRLKRVSTLNPSKLEFNSSINPDTVITFLPMDHVSTDGQIDAIELISASAVWNGFTFFKQSDVIIAKITPCFENGKGACLDCLPTEFGFGSTEFNVLRAKPIIKPRYLYLITIINEFRSLGKQMMTGAAGQQRVPSSFFTTSFVPLPSLPEQTAIVAFLDRETTRIDSLIEKKERQIELLREKRGALINHTVTKGLDPSAPMKESGVEWVDMVPKHWICKKIKYITTINSKSLGEDTSPDYELKYVDIGNVDLVEGIIRVEDYTFDEAPSRARRIVQNGDIIISTVRTYLKAITAIFEPEPNLIVSTGFAVVRPNTNLDSKFSYYTFTASYFVENVVANSNGVSYPAINASRIGDMKIPIPPLTEQKSIAIFLAHETHKINSLIKMIGTSIENLHEFRSALISAAVTGKIDVRHEVNL